MSYDAHNEFKVIIDSKGFAEAVNLDDVDYIKEAILTDMQDLEPGIYLARGIIDFTEEDLDVGISGGYYFYGELEYEKVAEIDPSYKTPEQYKEKLRSELRNLAIEVMNEDIHKPEDPEYFLLFEKDIWGRGFMLNYVKKGSWEFHQRVENYCSDLTKNNIQYIIDSVKAHVARIKEENFMKQGATLIPK